MACAPAGGETASRPVPATPGPMRLVEDDPSPALVSSVYVHAPFCPRRCCYCDFSVTVDPRGDLDGWVAALGAELAFVEAEGRFPLAPSLDTLFVGGGTPSLLGPEAMGMLAGVLGPERLNGDALEWTAEANPESFTRDVARWWRSAGVNRLSLGAQTFHAGALRWMGRLHGPSEPRAAAERARAEGIRNISLDLIFGLPAAVGRDWAADLDQALSLEVPHLSLYGLTAEKGTPLGRAVREGRVDMASDDAYREEFLQASGRLRAEGYRHYEVSNFARPGFEGRHNLVYWNRGPYLGLGNSAHSFLHPYRRWNLKDWGAYQSVAMSGRPPVESEEELTVRAARLERVWLGLRTSGGIRSGDLHGAAGDLAKAWILQGQATMEGGSVVLTPEGWLLLDHLAVAMDSALDQDDSERGAVPGPAGPGRARPSPPG